MKLPMFIIRWIGNRIMRNPLVPVEMAPVIRSFGKPVSWDEPTKSVPLSDLQRLRNSFPGDLTKDEIAEFQKRHRFDSLHTI